MASGHIHVCYPDWLDMHHDSVHPEVAGVVFNQNWPIVPYEHICMHVCLSKNTPLTQSDLSHTLVAAKIFPYQLFRLTKKHSDFLDSMIKKHSDFLDSMTSSKSEVYILQVWCNVATVLLFSLIQNHAQKLQSLMHEVAEFNAWYYMRRLACVHSVQNKNVDQFGDADIPMAGAAACILFSEQSQSLYRFLYLLCSYFTKGLLRSFRCCNRCWQRWTGSQVHQERQRRRRFYKLLAGLTIWRICPSTLPFSSQGLQEPKSHQKI